MVGGSCFNYGFISVNASESRDAARTRSSRVADLYGKLCVDVLAAGGTAEVLAFGDVFTSATSSSSPS